jgi:hypothetical protein
LYFAFYPTLRFIDLWPGISGTRTIGDQVDQIRESALVKSIDYLVISDNIEVIKNLAQQGD